MFVSGKSISERYVERHSILRSSYTKWIETIEASNFSNHNELKALFPKADYIGNKDMFLI
jgi:mRNA interferase HigB